jgi:hypothetical protein
MDFLGGALLIIMVIFFGIAAFANAFEASERHRRVQRDLERELEEIQKK